MLKQLMLGKKIEQAREVLNGYLEEEKKLATRSEELEVAIEEVKTDEEISAVEKEVTKLDTDKKGIRRKKIKIRR